MSVELLTVFALGMSSAGSSSRSSCCPRSAVSSCGAKARASRKAACVVDAKEKRVGISGEVRVPSLLSLNAVMREANGSPEASLSASRKAIGACTCRVGEMVGVRDAVNVELA